MKYNPIADYDADTNLFSVIAPTPELHWRGKEIPGAHWRKKEGRWVAPATSGVAARIVQLYEDDYLEGTPQFMWYVHESLKRLYEAANVLQQEKLPEIPTTAVQPKGKWYHQRRAFWFAYHLDAAMLAITMGGGKTKVAIDLMMNWMSQRVLIICPAAAIEDVWLPQLDKYCKRSFLTAYREGTETVADLVSMAEETMEFTEEQHLITLINHEAFWREPFRTWAASQDWDLIIDDEIHREKSAGSIQSKFLFQLSSRARRRLGLTGTPMPHSPLDVYGQFRFLDRGIFGTNHDRFLQEFAEKGGYQNQEIVGFKNIEELTRRFYTISILIDDSEQGLPETVDIEHKFTLDSKTRKAYTAMDKEFIARVNGGDIVAANAGVKLLRLHQLACGIAKTENAEAQRIDHSRLGALREVLGDFNRNEPVVIFVRFKPDLHDIRAMCEKMGRPVSLMGDGHNELQVWKKGRTNVLVAQIQAVKEGVDLTRSSIGIFYSTGLSLGDYLQCRKRLHRPPQERMVRFIHILAKATRDVSTMRALKERKEVVREALRDVRAGRGDT